MDPVAPVDPVAHEEGDDAAGHHDRPGGAEEREQEPVHLRKGTGGSNEGKGGPVGTSDPSAEMTRMRWP